MIELAMMHPWEIEQLLTAKDREVIDSARTKNWAEINEDDADTDAGRYLLHLMISAKYHREEYMAGLD